jgi:8-oxo-dGTP diphosphatase
MPISQIQPRPPNAEVVAAGAVLWRPGPNRDGIEIAVVHRPRYDDWSLPKGKLNRRETPLAAAVREVAEETGFTAFPGVRLGETRYRVAEGEKVVHYWFARAGDGRFSPNDEVDELRWLSPEAAAGLLSYSHDSALLEHVRALSPPPHPLLLVRHAKAGSRDKWDGDDDLRPLLGKGPREAEELADLLALFGPTRAYTAPLIRCEQSLRPLARRCGLTVIPEPLLSERGYGADPEAGLARLLELAEGPGVAVVCSQGGVIPDVVEKLTGSADPPARKASTWVLGFTEGRVIKADYYDEPGLHG